jgi:hypothetical protein
MMRSCSLHNSALAIDLEKNLVRIPFFFYNSAMSSNYNGYARQEYLQRVTELGEFPAAVWTALHKTRFSNTMTSDRGPAPARAQPPRAPTIPDHAEGAAIAPTRSAAFTTSPEKT